MVAPRQPTVVGRGLGSELRALRKARRMTLKAVAERLGWPLSKVSRIETGKQGIRPTDVASLLVVYEVTGAEHKRLLTMAERSGERGWWEIIGGLSKESRTLIQLESEATSIFDFEPLLIPGLLQTPDYTRAVMHACGVPEPDLEGRVAARMGRQAILSRSDPPTFHAILDEPALRRVLGSGTTMARQLRRLSELAEYPNVVIQILPFELGGHTGLDGAFVVLDFRHNRPVVHLEHKISGAFLEEPDQVAYFRREIDRLLDTALSPGKSEDLIARVARQHERE
jgi:transcriptional regulator with XRE-family HTH domain